MRRRPMSPRMKKAAQREYRARAAMKRKKRGY
jgi:hypothetical protein